MIRYYLIRAIVSALFCAQSVFSGPLRAELNNGTISYEADDGVRRTVEIGRMCLDLWVAPDESAFVFIGIDQSSPLPGRTEPFVLASSIYVARRANHFMPVRVPIPGVVIDGRQWNVFREPRILADGKTFIFTIPIAVTYGRIFAAHDGSSNTPEMIGDAVRFCVGWNNDKQNAVLMQRRQPSILRLGYSCYAKPPGGPESKLSDECDDFEQFSKSWLTNNHGSCT